MSLTALGNCNNTRATAIRQALQAHYLTDTTDTTYTTNPDLTTLRFSVCDQRFHYEHIQYRHFALCERGNGSISEDSWFLDYHPLHPLQLSERPGEVCCRALSLPFRCILPTLPNILDQEEDTDTVDRRGEISPRKWKMQDVLTSEQEIDELVDDWTPEPLAIAPTPFEEAENEKRPVIVG